MREKATPPTSRELLDRVAQQGDRRVLTVADVLLGKSPIRKEAIKGHLSYLRQGCLKNCLSGDVRGRVT